MPAAPVTVHIPDDVDFAQLRLTRDTQTGDISFNWAPILRICEASGIDPAHMQEGPEDNVGALLVAWYAEHLRHGGARDPVQDELIAEAALEDAHGHGYSHAPGRA